MELGEAVLVPEHGHGERAVGIAPQVVVVELDAV